MKSASPFSISALISVYNEGEEWLEQLNEYLDGTMEWVVQFLAENMPKVKVKIPEGTYVMWMDFSDTVSIRKKSMSGFIIKRMSYCRTGSCLAEKESIIKESASLRQGRS